MPERRYTLAEIDGMRDAIGLMLRGNGPYYPDEMNRKIEDRLRTYMLAGIGPAELHELAQKIQSESERRWLAARRSRAV